MEIGNIDQITSPDSDFILIPYFKIDQLACCLFGVEKRTPLRPKQVNPATCVRNVEPHEGALRLENPTKQDE